MRKAVRHCFSMACSGSTVRFASDCFRCADLRFIEEHRRLRGVESMCKILQIVPSTYYDRRTIADDPDRASRRAKSDAALSVKIDAAWQDKRKLYGARKDWHILRRKGEDVARCTVERFMRVLGIRRHRRRRDMVDLIESGA